MEFTIVIGPSGAGESRVISVLGDIRFYYVDNIPLKLIPTFYDPCSRAKEGFQRIVVVTGIRGGTPFDGLSETSALMREEGKKCKILFLDAGDFVLINRFKETWRKHSLAEEYLGSLEQAVQMERQIPKAVWERSDYIIDTSFLSPAQLKEWISSLLLDDASAVLTIHCVSLGFKYDLPLEADLVFDVRCLPSPFCMKELKRQTGLDEPVREYVMEWDQIEGFITRFLDMIDHMLPLCCGEGKSQLATAIGCTSSRHHSVAPAQLLYNHSLENRERASVNHRDVHKQEKRHVIFV